MDPDVKSKEILSKRGRFYKEVHNIWMKSSLIFGQDFSVSWISFNYLSSLNDLAISFRTYDENGVRLKLMLIDSAETNDFMNVGISLALVSLRNVSSEVIKVNERNFDKL
jgi:hypothetical protein